jgi:hypothetical protein
MEKKVQRAVQAILEAVSAGSIAKRERMPFLGEPGKPLAS